MDYILTPVREEEIASFVAEANSIIKNDHDKWHKFVNSRKFFVSDIPDIDPTSRHYFDFQMDLWKLVSGRRLYSAEYCEANNNLDHVKGICDFFPFVTKSNQEISNYFIAVASILKNIERPAPASILEFGVGWGHTARFLSNCGYRVVAVDIEKRFLSLLPDYSLIGSVPIVPMCTSFNDFSHVDESFDCVIFFECFHHCIDHIELLNRLHGLLKPKGQIIFCAESFYDDWFDFPWGVRLDGHSVWAIRNFGWMELGFRKAYILDVLTKLGFNVRFSKVDGIGSYGEFCIATI